MKPLVKATKSNAHFKGDEKLIKATAAAMNVSLEESRKILNDEIERETIWVNDIYQVATHTYEHPKMGKCMQINIRRRDGNVIFRDWRHFQAIKNQLAGPECEGVEIYPAESRKVDQNNKYHIWCVLNPEMRIPFGWQERMVDEPTPEAKGLHGMRQRPLDPTEPESRRNRR